MRRESSRPDAFEPRERRSLARGRGRRLGVFVSIGCCACALPSERVERPFGVTRMGAMAAVSPSPEASTPREPATPLPSASAAFAPSPTAPTLTPEVLPPGTVPDVPRVMATLLPDLKRCYERSLRNGPMVDLRFSISIEVGADGRVLAATIDDARVPPDLHDCILRRVRKVTFSAPDRAPAHVEVPVALLPR